MLYGYFKACLALLIFLKIIEIGWQCREFWGDCDLGTPILIYCYPWKLWTHSNKSSVNIDPSGKFFTCISGLAASTFCLVFHLITPLFRFSNLQLSDFFIQTSKRYMFIIQDDSDHFFDYLVSFLGGSCSIFSSVSLRHFHCITPNLHHFL